MPFVYVTHPDVEGSARVPERALLYYESKGWQKVAADPPEPPQRPQRNDKTDAWRDYAVSRGLDPAAAADMSRDGDDGLIAWIDQRDAADTPEES